MIEISKEEEINIKKIYGAKKYQKWLKEYSVIKNSDVLSWIRDKIDKYTDEGKEANKFSITTYLKPLQQYCLYNEVDNPSKLLEEKIDKRNSRVKKYLNFLIKVEENDEKLKELGFSKKPGDVSIRNFIQSRIKSFYSNRGANISFSMKTRKSGANKEELTLDKDTIRQIQNKLESIQYRLICKFETQEGMRIGDVLDELTGGKYKLELHKNHYFIRKFETQKEKVIINYLFFTQELSELLQSTYPGDLKELNLKELFKTRKGNRINKNDYLARLKEIVKELNIGENIKTHAFRKYFTSQISQRDYVDENFNKHIEGREPDYREDVYLRHFNDINWFYEKWLIIEKKVCVDCIIVNKTSKKVLDLEQTVMEKDKQIKILLEVKIETEKKLKEQEEELKAQSTEFSNIKESFKIKSEATDKEFEALKEKIAKFDEIMTPEIFTAIKREFIKKDKELEEESKN